MAQRALTSLAVVLLSGLVAGCNPHLKAPDGTRVSLHDYDAVSLRSVTIDPELPYPGLPRQLSTAISGQLYLSKMWVQEDDADLGAAAEQAGRTPRMLDLCVNIESAHYPRKAARVFLGAPHRMRCQMDVYDHVTSQLLGSAHVSASRGPPTHGLLGGGVMGVIVNAATDHAEINELLVYYDMGARIVRVLERAKKHRPAGQRPRH